MKGKNVDFSVGGNEFKARIQANPTADRIVNLPDKPGTIAFTSDFFTPQIADFESSGSATIPIGCRRVRLWVLSGAGGGASGRKGGLATNRFGGGAGAGGNVIECEYDAAALGGPGTVLTVVVGAGGLGGAAVTTDDTSGNAGTQGGNSSVSVGATGSTTLAFSAGGNPGLGGTTSTGNGGTGISDMAGGGSGSNATTTAVGGAGVISFYAGAGGGCGGSIDAANVIRGVSAQRWGGTFIRPSAIVGGSKTTPGANGDDGTSPPFPQIGSNGQGGVPNSGGDSGRGGDGGRGCAGGGGGAATNGVGVAQRGGNGGAGGVRITFL